MIRLNTEKFQRFYFAAKIVIFGRNHKYGVNSRIFKWQIRVEYKSLKFLTIQSSYDHNEFDHCLVEFLPRKGSYRKNFGKFFHWVYPRFIASVTTSIFSCFFSNIFTYFRFESFLWRSVGSLKLISVPLKFSKFL